MSGTGDAIAAPAFMLTRVGTTLGGRVGSAAPELAEKLIAVGIALLVEQVTA